MARKYRNAKLDFEYSYNLDERDELDNLLNNKTNFNEDTLRRAALWKLNRILSIPDDVIERLRKLVRARNLSISDKIVEETLASLVNCQGVGYPMASTILKFLRPDIFPIIDKRAVRAIQGKLPYGDKYFTYNRYKEYTKKLVEIRKAQGLEMWEVDEQLYCWDKKHNGSLTQEK